MESACLDFLNSEFRDFRGRWVRDDLLQPTWLEAFLVRWNLQVSEAADAPPLDLLLALRTLLQRIVEVLASGNQPSMTDMSALNAYLLNAPLQRHLLQEGQQYRLAMIPLERNWHWVHAEIVASFAELLVKHDPLRLKVCANEHCRYVFYDESKSRTRRYCTIDKCANLVKVRRFRARQRDEPEEI